MSILVAWFPADWVRPRFYPERGVARPAPFAKGEPRGFVHWRRGNWYAFIRHGPHVTTFHAGTSAWPLRELDVSNRVCDPRRLFSVKQGDRKLVELSYRRKTGWPDPTFDSLDESVADFFLAVADEADRLATSSNDLGRG